MGEKKAGQMAEGDAGDTGPCLGGPKEHAPRCYMHSPAPLQIALPAQSCRKPDPHPVVLVQPCAWRVAQPSNFLCARLSWARDLLRIRTAPRRAVSSVTVLDGNYLSVSSAMPVRIVLVGNPGLPGSAKHDTRRKPTHLATPVTEEPFVATSLSGALIPALLILFEWNPLWGVGVGVRVGISCRRRL